MGRVIVGRYLLVGWAALVFCSCGTLTGRHQRVPIVSDKPAEIFVDGKKVGVTPKLVKIKRKKSAQIRLVSRQGEEKNFHLNTKFRWDESFYTPFFFGPYLLVSLVTDWVDGNLWEYEYPKKTNFDKNSQPFPLTRVAVMPPLSDREMLSDEIQKHLVQWSEQRYGKQQVIPLEEVSPSFEQIGVSYDSRPRREGIFVLQKKHSPSHLIDAKTYLANDHIMTHVKVIDTWTQEPVQQEILYVPREKIKSLTWGSWWKEQLYQLVPNAVGFGFSQPANDKGFSFSGEDWGIVETTNYSFEVYPEDYSDVIRKNYSFRLTNLRHHYQREPMNFFFRFVPEASLFFNKFRVTALREGEVISTDHLQTFGVSLGVGPELRFDTAFGSLAATSIWSVGYENVSTDSEKIITRDFTHLYSNNRFSFTTFFTDAIGVRLETGVNVKSVIDWQQVGNELTDKTFWTTQSTFYEGYTGVSVFYYLPEGRTKVKSELRKENIL